MNKQRDRLVELIQKATAEAGKYFRETTKKVVAEKGHFNSAIDIDRRNIYEIEADHLLANGVIVPPLNIGDKVWIIDWGYEIAEYEVANMRYTKDLNGQRYSYDALMVGKNGADIGFFDSDIGKYVFLSREEALSKLQASCKQVKGGAEK